MKKFISILLCLCVVLVQLPVTGMATQTEANVTVSQTGDPVAKELSSSQTHTHCICSDVISGKDTCESHNDQQIWQPWEDSTTLPTTSGNWYLTVDVKVTGKDKDIRVENADVKICLNGHSVTRDDSVESNCYRISVWDANAKLTIMDCTGTVDEAGMLTTAGKITGATYGTNGGIYARGGELTLLGVEVTGCVNNEATAGYGGGAMQVRNGAKVNLHYCKITNNTAKSDGGAICVKNGTVKAENSLFSGNNSCIRGGVVFLEAAGCSLTMKNCQVLNNQAKNATIYALASNVDLNNVTISGNECSGDGGSVLHVASGGKAVLKDCTITQNKSTKLKDYCGALYLPNNNSSITISGEMVVDDNTVSSGKEVNVFLQNAGTKLTLDGLAEGSKLGITTLTAYTDVDDPDVFLAAKTGISSWDMQWITYENAGLFVDYSSDQNFFFVDINAHRHVACSCAFTDNDSCGHTQNDQVKWMPWEDPTTLPTTTGNWYLTVDVKVAGKDKDIRVENADVKICLNGHSVTRDDTVASNCYRISVWDANSKLTIMDCTATVDEAGMLATAGKITDATYGTNGGIYARGGELTLLGVEVNGCVNNEATATYGGGAMQVRNGAKANLHYCKITNNTAKSDGGAICIKSGTVKAENTVFSGNTANNRGGAVFLEAAGCNLTMKNCQVLDNQAKNAAIYALGAEVNLDTVTISGNECSGDGGSALHVAASGKAVLKDCTVTKNKSTKLKDYCGALYLPNNNSSITISGVMVVDDNTVSNGTEVNVFLQNAGTKLTLDGLAEGSKLGITTLTAYTDADDPDVFLTSKTPVTSWNGQWVVYENNRLNINYSEEESFFFWANTDHHHCFCGGKVAGCTHESVAWLPWKDDQSLPTGSGSYYLTKDVTLTAFAVIKDETVNLCLNGKTVTAPTGENVDSKIYVLRGAAVLNISDCTASNKDGYTAGQLTGATATALWMDPGTSQLNLYDGLVQGNHADKSGGAVRLNGSNVFRMYGGSLTNNSAITAGAVYVTGGSQVELHAGTIVNNIARNNEAGTEGFGGAVLLLGGSTMQMLGGEINSNSAAVGGGIYTSTDTELTLTGGKICNNKAKQGGGICTSQKCTVNLQGTAISGNQAEVEGGGVLFQGKEAQMTFTSGTISNNKAQSGGGIFISSNTVFTMTGGTVSGNRAETGGGIFQFLTDATYDGGQIQRNTATKSGGGLCTSQKSTVNLKGVSISGNSAAEFGGGVLLQGYGSVLNMSAGTVSGNEAQNGGGGMFISTNTTLNFYGGTVRNNYAGKTGGGIQHLTSTGNYSGGSVRGNTVGENGGGICTSQKCTINFCGTQVCNNEATQHAGGILLQGYGSHMTFSDGLVSENKAGGQGGGMFISTNTSLKMTGGTVSGNEAASSGGGVYILNCTATLAGGKIADNHSGLNGGGLCTSQKCVLNLAGTLITGNRAVDCGGGVVLQGYESVMNYSSGDICENKARLGGGLFVSTNTLLNMTGGLLAENTATEAGGGLYLYYGDATITGGLVEKNSAQTVGGGLYASYAEITASALQLRENTAQGNGGGAFMDQMAVLKLENTQISKNTSGSDGGAFCLGIGSAAELKNVKITENIAAGKGGALYAIDDLTMESLEAASNTSGTGGAVYLDESGYDGRSYMAGVMIISGDMRICDNTPGIPDLFIGEGTTVCVGTLGLTENTRMEVALASGLLTDTIFGAYDYEGGNLIYTVTSGDRSLREPEGLPVEETPEKPTEPMEEIPEERNNGILYIVLGAATVVVIAVLVIVLLCKRKTKGE